MTHTYIRNEIDVEIGKHNMPNFEKSRRNSIPTFTLNYKQKIMKRNLVNELYTRNIYYQPITSVKSMYGKLK